MRTKTKAVLLNALIFPGTGQLLMKRRWRGLLYIAVTLGCLVVVFTVLYSIAVTLAEPVPVDDMVNNIQILKEELLYKFSEDKNAWPALALLVLVWVTALLDAILTRNPELAADQKEQSTEQ